MNYGRNMEAKIQELVKILGAEKVSTQPADKIAYARDLWTYLQIGFGETDQKTSSLRPSRAYGPEGPSVQPPSHLTTSLPVEYPPDAIAWPESAEEVARVLKWAGKNGVPVIPFGAGSGVCGGTVPIKGGLILDLKRMDKIIGIDENSLLATVQSGIMGEILERRLNERGFSLGHFPSSIYCSTLGGWLAGRSAGQLSTKYGKIEDMVLGLEVVLPSGEIMNTRVTPRAATGPDLKQLFVGSEGIFGVITQATMEIHREPETRTFFAMEFKGISPALGAIRTVLQRGIKPAVARLYDELDTFLVGSRGKEIGDLPLPDGKGKGEGITTRLRDEILKKGERFFLTRPKMLNRLAALAPEKCLLILVFEGFSEQVKVEETEARALGEKAGGAFLGPDPGLAWWESRYAVSYQLSKIFTAGAFADTIEVSTTWSNLEKLYYSMREAVSPHALIMAHFSHAYTTGCSIYFTTVAQAPTAEEKRKLYELIWKAAMDACARAGGSISHHHGIGKLKGPWMVEEWGTAGMETLRALKRTFDPRGIMNPGKLGI